MLVGSGRVIDTGGVYPLCINVFYPAPYLPCTARAPRWLVRAHAGAHLGTKSYPIHGVNCAEAQKGVSMEKLYLSGLEAVTFR